jgi:hypothetical protein
MSATSAPRPSRSGRRPSVAPREVVLGLDRVERIVSLFSGYIAVVLAAFSLIGWLNNAAIDSTTKYVKGKACPALYRHVNTLCIHSYHDKSGWEIQFYVVAALALATLYFGFMRKRAGVIVTTFLLVFKLGLGIGFVFLFTACWLLIRAWRLNKYGDPTLRGSAQIAKDMSTAKKHGETYTPVYNDKASEAVRPKPAKRQPKAIVAEKAAPRESSRYTPKKRRSSSK